jgi:hypothetical protein
VETDRLLPGHEKERDRGRTETEIPCAGSASNAACAGSALLR